MILRKETHSLTVSRASRQRADERKGQLPGKTHQNRTTCFEARISGKRTYQKKKKGKTLQENSDYKQVHSIKTWFHSYSVSNEIFQMNLGKQ